MLKDAIPWKGLFPKVRPEGLIRGAACFQNVTPCIGIVDVVKSTYLLKAKTLIVSKIILLFQEK